jgi:long-subunit acyl-CoA synthetase (AMP-forming)
MTKQILEHVYDKEASIGDSVYLTQPIGNGDVKDYTWKDVVGESRRMAAHLQGMGFEPGDRIAILSKNCAHFFMAELAIWMAGFTTVAIFPTEGPDTINYVLTHSDAKALFVGKLDTWKEQETGVPSEVKRIAFPLAPKNDFAKWDDIVKESAPLEGRVKRKGEDLAMIIYTSGSTGRPKGVMHNFDRISYAAEGFVKAIKITNEDRVLSYLPLAHVFERAAVQCTTLVGGGRVFFAESLETFVKDIQRAQPTVFISVPRLWLKFQQGVFKKMPPKKLDLYLKIPIFNKIVAKKVLTGLGLQHVRLAASGSAPIPAELIAWYRKVGLNLLEGYAMSEDFAYSHLSTPEHAQPGYVGIPLPGVDCKLSPEGEILIKSPARLVGYFKQPELDAEIFTEDGFFRTGDKGERTSDGMLKLTGRVKELFKTAKGKYVAPAPIENMLNEHPLVEMSCVSGVGQPAAYALLVLAEDIRPKLKDPETRSTVERELAPLLEQINARVSGYEQLQMLVIADTPWSIENGMLTPTMKIKRSKIEDQVKDKLESWYGSKGPVVWG